MKDWNYIEGNEENLRSMPSDRDFEVLFDNGMISNYYSDELPFSEIIAWREISRENNSTESYLNGKIKDGLINNELEPIKCECGSVDFKDVVVDRIENIITEFDRFCSKCNDLIGYWSYGKWMP